MQSWLGLLPLVLTLLQHKNQAGFHREKVVQSLPSGKTLTPNRPCGEDTAVTPTSVTVLSPSGTPEAQGEVNQTAWESSMGQSWELLQKKGGNHLAKNIENFIVARATKELHT